LQLAQFSGGGKLERSVHATLAGDQSSIR